MFNLKKKEKVSIPLQVPKHPLYIKSVNVNDYAAKNRKSIELAARELRYLTLEKTLNNIGYNKIKIGRAHV